MRNLEPEEKLQVAIDFENRLTALLEEYYQTTGWRVEEVSISWYTYQSMPPTKRRDSVASISLRSVAVRE